MLLLISLIAILVLILVGLALSQKDKRVDKIQRIICDILGLIAIPLVINSFNDIRENQKITSIVYICILLSFLYIWFDVFDFTKMHKNFKKILVFIAGWTCWWILIMISLITLILLMYIVCIKLYKLI